MAFSATHHLRNRHPTTDYLNGDNYFRIHRPGHNLDRCRTQFKLVESIAQQEETMQKIVNKLNGVEVRKRRATGKTKKR